MITLSPAERRALLDRFLRYVQVDTQSDEASTTHPSTEKQTNLGRMLVDELRALGCIDAALAETGHVVATVPPNVPDDSAAAGKVPVIGLLAHLDTYPGTPGANVRPQVIDAYAGGDIVLPATGATISAAAHPGLSRCLGHTLIHTDGTTLLGADDKAGIAVIMSLVDWLGRHPDFRHGKVRIAFTPDEEIGRGVECFDVAAFAADYAYTLDGAGIGEVEDETFSADSATVTITGHDVHPGQAKNVMVNAVRVASAIVASLPVDSLPETTEDRQPYLHAHAITGEVSRAQVRFLVRAFSEAELIAREDVLRSIVARVGAEFPGARVELDIKRSYRNMGDHIAKDRKVLDYAMEAVRRQGIEPVRRAVRGGTDGSRLSALGLLTPNIFAGGQSMHAVTEWASLDWMTAAVGTCVHLLEVWAESAR